jgi:hypothetical protein
MKTLTDLAVQGIAQEGGEVRNLAFVEEDYQGTQMRCLKGIPRMKLTPCYAVTDRFLVLSGSVDMVKSAIDQMRAPTRSIRDSAMWAEARGRVPAGAGFISISDPAAGAAQMITTLQEVTMPVLGEAIGRDEVLKQMLAKDPTPLRNAIQKNSFATVITVTSEPDGIIVQGHTQVGSSSVIVPAFLGVAGMGGYMAYQFSGAFRADMDMGPPAEMPPGPPAEVQPVAPALPLK